MHINTSTDPFINTKQEFVTFINYVYTVKNFKNNSSF